MGAVTLNKNSTNIILAEFLAGFWWGTISFPARIKLSITCKTPLNQRKNSISTLCIIATQQLLVVCS